MVCQPASRAIATKSRHLAKVQEEATADFTKLNPDVALPDLTPRFVGWAETR
ncbi:hypothetical protein [Micromonospora sp. NPDC048842]|uniref:hypothetical protein n=1 Tax=unclassified Micromonospora TaxID=2617518 RepID=UPI0033EAD4A0